MIKILKFDIGKKAERVNFGDVYFYINEFFEIGPTRETNSENDFKLHQAGNYFNSREEAEKAIIKG